MISLKEETMDYLHKCDFKQEEDLMKIFPCQIVWNIMEDWIVVGVLSS
jgi:hypothetical protein